MSMKKRVKILCIRKGISQSELSRRLGLEPSNFWRRVEKNNFNIEQLETIAKETDTISVNYFKTENGEKI